MEIKLHVYRGENSRLENMILTIGKLVKPELFMRLKFSYTMRRGADKTWTSIGLREEHFYVFTREKRSRIKSISSNKFSY